MGYKEITLKNPHVPDVSVGDELSDPKKWLERYLLYLAWVKQNTDPGGCRLCQGDELDVLRQNRLCCLNETTRAVEEFCMMKAGEKIGLVFIPDGYRQWGQLAEERLTELQGGVNNVLEWTQRIEPLDDDLYAWIAGPIYEDPTKFHPYFSVQTFIRVWQSNGLEPRDSEIALAFGLKPENNLQYWS